MTSTMTLSAIMMISGQRKPVQNALSKNSIGSLRCGQHLPGGKPRAFRHHGRRTRDRVGQVEVLDERLERRLLRRAALARELLDLVGRTGFDLFETDQMRHGLEDGLAQGCERVVAELLAKS